MAKGLFAAIGLLLALAAPALAVVPELLPPSWSALTKDQQQILAPLAEDWDALDDARKRKWLGIAARYPSMTADEQQRVQARMREWARLSPEQRQKAREQFMYLQRTSPEQREAIKQRWQEYQSLPDSEKQRLKKESAPPGRLTVRPPVIKPISGAAPARLPALKPRPAEPTPGEEEAAAPEAAVEVAPATPETPDQPASSPAPAATP